MRYCYAHRRFTLYPNSLDTWDLSTGAYTDEFLGRVRAMGFDSIEVGSDVIDSIGQDEAAIADFGKRLADAGVPIGAIRSGGSLTNARYAQANLERMLRMVRAAGITGAEVVNGALSTPNRYPTITPMHNTGLRRSQDGSREGTMKDYETLADALQAGCDVAADSGVVITIEVHQNSLVDNSWSALLTHDMVDRPNFGINPDLGNIYWCYDEPEETMEDAIVALAPVSKYWHCKNMYRVYHPENHRAVYVRTNIVAGEIDYRFAISAMANAGYSGYMAIEGVQAGDQFYHDGQSLDYAKSIWADFE